VIFLKLAVAAPVIVMLVMAVRALWKGTR